MSKQYEIAPGYGNDGIAKARRVLMDALRDRIDKCLDMRKKVEVYQDRACPCVRVVFDEHTTMWIVFWPHGPGGGFDPRVDMQTSRRFDLTKCGDEQDRVEDHTMASEVTFDVVRRVLANVTLIEVP